MDLSSYHVTNLGAYGRGLIADLHGYVHLTRRAVLGGTWDAKPADLRAEAARIWRHNRRATREAERALAVWRES